MRKQTKKLTRYGLLVALALILSYLEAQLPAFYAVPGMKLGLTNLVVVVALYGMGSRSAMIINLVRILLVALLFGNAMSLAYSLAGGMLSCLVMIMLKRCGRFSTIAISAVGGICHNVGQILVAMLLLQTTGLGWYLLILWFTGLAAGIVIGLIGGEVTRLLQKHKWGENT